MEDEDGRKKSPEKDVLAKLNDAVRSLDYEEQEDEEATDYDEVTKEARPKAFLDDRRARREREKMRTMEAW